MYAIVEIAGQQFKVQKDQKIFVHRLAEKEGDQVVFDKVFLTVKEGEISVGAPAIEGIQVNAKVLRHLKDDKVIVFKKKRRKGYKVKRGHRQYLTEIQIEEIAKKSQKPLVEAKEVKPEKAKKETSDKVEVASKNTLELKKMTVAQLKAMAKEKGLKGYSSMKKEELIEALSGLFEQN